MSTSTVSNIRSTPAAARRPHGRGPDRVVRLTRRGRLVVFLAALAVVLGLFVAFGSSVVASDEAGDPAAVTTVTVQPGQTMWEIAREANPSGDVRHTVHEIAELNALPSAGQLPVGEQIAVPRY